MENLTPLCKLAYKYRTDKCPQIFHTYTPVYYKMFKDKKESFKKVLELGIGTMDTMRHTQKYAPGASLRMWRDFFPNAKIYGIDIAEESMFTEDRIETFLKNTLKERDLKNLIKTIGSDIDLVVDDGPHHPRYQILTANMLMPLLDKKTIYIIEDCCRPNLVKEKLPKYDVEILKLERVSGDNNLLIVKHK